jgi:hypothetical protein
MPLSNAFHDGICQKQKLRALFIAESALIGIILCSLARFIPAFDDWLSGAPEYARPIADIIAEDMAAKLKGLYPILVVKADNPECRHTETTVPTESSDPYYLIDYSENSRSVCVTRLEKTDRRSASSIEISQATGRNYGRALQEPIRVEPVQRYPVNCDSRFLDSLHWRVHPKRVDSSGVSRTSQLPDARAFQEVLQGFSITSLRDRVAEGHNLVNRLLALSLGVMIAALFIAAYRVRILYERFVQYCSTYDFDLRLATYLHKNVTVIARQAQTEYYTKHAYIQAQVRGEKILRRTKRGARDDLLASFQTSRDDQQRALIETCLANGSLAEMKSLLRRLSEQPMGRTASERLEWLLESLKEFCMDDEFEPCRETAVGILENRGFHDARAFVVHVHRELRKKAQELEDHKGGEKDSPIPGAMLPSKSRPGHSRRR